MIVSYTESGWQIVTQRSHGLLAAQICAQWQKNSQPSRWLETLIATAEHDDVHIEFESEDLLNENGGPKNFKQTVFRYRDCERQIGMAATKSAYIALLISRHIQFVHGKNPDAKAFCVMLKKQEKSWLKIAGSEKSEADRSYELLEFCDAFSLLLCQGLVQPEHRKIEISNGPDGRPYQMHATGENKITISPWPFELPSFQVSFETRTVEQLTFTSTEEFRRVIAGVIPGTQTLTISNSA